MSYPTYILSYDQWKATRTAVGGTTYVVAFDKSYVALVISSTTERVQIYRADIIRFPDDPNLSDFEANILPTATQKDTIEDAIAAELA